MTPFRKKTALGMGWAVAVSVQTRVRRLRVSANLPREYSRIYGGEPVVHKHEGNEKIKRENASTNTIAAALIFLRFFNHTHAQFTCKLRAYTPKGVHQCGGIQLSEGERF